MDTIKIVVVVVTTSISGRQDSLSIWPESGKLTKQGYEPTMLEIAQQERAERAGNGDHGHGS